MFMTLVLAGAVETEAAPSARLGPVVVPGERTAAIPRVQPNASVGTGIPYGAVEVRQPFDPADRTPFAFDFSDLLTDDEKIADVISIRLGSAAPALGITIDIASDRSPMIDSVAGQKAQFNLLVDEAQQDAASYLNSGVRMPVTMKIETDATPPNNYERSIIVAMRQL